jgi:hypothetical protein
VRVLAIALTAVLIVLSVTAIVGAFAVLARRLLGLRFGLVRLLLAGLAGFLVAGPIAQSLAGSMPDDGGAITPLWLLILAGACALVVAMIFLVVAEALVPSGRCRGRWSCGGRCGGGSPGPVATPRSAGSRSATASAPTSGAGGGPSWTPR